MSKAAAQPGPSADAADPAGLGLRVQVRVEFAVGQRLGPGKIDLLEAIGQSGSITAAGRRLGMSYRRAWLLVADLNRLFDAPVVETVAGGAHGGGAKLTEIGQRLVAAYRALERDTREMAEAKLAPFCARCPNGRPVPSREGP